MHKVFNQTFSCLNTDVKLHAVQNVLSPHLLSRYGKNTESDVQEQGAEENIQRPNRNEVTRSKTKLHKEKFHNYYSSPNSIKMDQIEEDQMGEVYSTHRVHQ
jgi:hypothetical protein